jgi:protein involved in polysaccharide export with SLBB domain
MAVLGKVNSPAVFELKGEKDGMSDFLSLAGGLSVMADPRRATLDSITPGIDLPRSVKDISLVGAGLNGQIKNGDVLTVMPLVPELSNAITLRGAVSQPGRMAWRSGLSVSDVISNRSMLITADTLRRQNEAVFDNYSQERTARGRARVPADLATERALLERSISPENSQQSLSFALPGGSAKAVEPITAKTSETTKPTDIFERDLAVAQLGKPLISEESLAERVGQLSEQVNLDYAVIERFSRETLQYTLLPFSLRSVLTRPKGQEDLALEPGDIITVFSNKDIQIPTSRSKSFVRVEGEVNKPGIYPVEPGDNLKSMIQKAGGTTAEAYLFATGLFREEVKKSQQRNMEKLLRKMEAESSAAVAQISQSGGASADPAVLQAKVQSVQQAQKQSLERFRLLKPEGRISLGIQPSITVIAEQFPSLRLENGDKIYIPSRPDFIQIFGSVNTESALVYRQGLIVKDYIKLAGISALADINGAILVRADGSAMTNQSYWGNDVLSAQVLPGDTIVLPEKFDRESAWSQTVRSAKDFTQVLYQLGLGAAAIKTLRQ